MKVFSRRFTSFLLIGVLLSTIATPLQTNTASAAANTLTYSFYSPDNPWTAEELGILQSWVTRYYPVMVQVFGEPSHSYTVNVKKDTNTGYGGYFTNYSDEIGMREILEEVFVHESLHAFRDENVLRSDVWEEGMVEAAEVEVFNRAVPTRYGNTSHSYYYDTYYDVLNTPALAPSDGNIWLYKTSSLALTRYHLAGYAWGKALIENPTFLSRFNSSLYAANATNPNILNDETALVNIVSGIQSQVEGQAFKSWYAGQHILDSTAQDGCFLFHRAPQFWVDSFCRTAGRETPSAGVTVTSKAYDVSNRLLSTVVNTTAESGSAELYHYNLPWDYVGRVKIVLSATINGTSVTDTTYLSRGDQMGVYGTATNEATGTITFSSLDGKFSQFNVPVSQGVYAAPSLQTVRGRMKAVFITDKGSVTRTFTKDAATYVLNLTGTKATKIVVVSGSAQSAKINTKYQKALVVKVTDSAGKPVKDTKVTFTAPTSGARVTFNGSSSVTVRSDANGVATSPIPQANGTSGAFTVKATANGLSSTVSFGLTNNR